MTLRLALLALVVALATPLASAKAFPSAPHGQRDGQRDCNGERERDVVRRARDQVPAALKQSRRRVDAGYGVQPAAEQRERHVDRREEERQEDRQLPDWARLPRPQPPRDPAPPET